MEKAQSSTISVAINIIGWIATACLLGAYFANSFEYLSVKGPLYHILNIIGGIGVMLISFYKRAWQPGVINVFWTFIAAINLIRLFSF